MRLLAGVNPLASATCEAESFHSVLQRTALAHNVSFTRLIVFLNAVCHQRVDARPRTTDLVASVLGPGVRSQSLVDAYEELTGKTGLANHTLLPLAGVIATRAKGAYIGYQRWCPVCIDPDKGIGYGMLAHTLRGVNSCKAHGARLQWFCPNCLRHQTYMAMLFARPFCSSCKAPLWKSADPTISRPAYESWAEDQLYDMVAYLTDADRPRPSTHWMQDAADTLRRLGAQIGQGLRGVDRPQAAILRRAPKHGFQLPTLLWLAAYHSTSLVEVILRPNEALSAIIPHLEHVRRAPSQRRVFSETRWNLLQSAVSALLEAGAAVRLPALDTVSALIGGGGIWVRQPALAKHYNQARAGYACAKLSLACDQMFVEELLQRRSNVVASFAVERILVRKKRPIPPRVAAQVKKAAEIVSGVVGRIVTTSPHEIGLQKHIQPLDS